MKQIEQFVLCLLGVIPLVVVLAVTAIVFIKEYINQKIKKRP